MGYSERGELSLAKYRTAKRNLSDLYVAEKALVKQMTRNREIIKNENPAELRKIDFSKRIESAEARKYALKKAMKDVYEIKEADFGNSKHSKAQAIIDSMQIQEQFGIRNYEELIETINYTEKNLVRLKEALARCENMTSYYENLKQNCGESEFVKISKQIYEFKKEHERICAIINSREQEYIALQRVLYGRNASRNIYQDEYKEKINYSDLFERHKIQIDYEHGAM